jgi:hypothetical protein
MICLYVWLQQFVSIRVRCTAVQCMANAAERCQLAITHKLLPSRLQSLPGNIVSLLHAGSNAPSNGVCLVCWQLGGLSCEPHTF